MEYLRKLFLFFVSVVQLGAVEIPKDRILPYEKFDLSILYGFLPSDPIVFIAGDQIANTALQIIERKNNTSVFCFPSELDEFEALQEYRKTNEGMQPYFGVLRLSDLYLCELFQKERLKRVDLFYLNCPEKVMQILQNNIELILDASAVNIKTENSMFEELNQLMIKSDFELMTQHFCDDVNQYALYTRKWWWKVVDIIN